MRKLAFPVRGSVQPKGRYRVYAAKDFNYVAVTLASGSDGVEAIAALAQAAERDGLSLTGASRLVVLDGDGAIEFQLGVDRARLQ